MIFSLPPLAAEQIFHISSFPVFNTYINSTIVLVLFLIIGSILRKKNAEIPDKIQNFAEGILEVVLGYMDQVTHKRKKSLKFLARASYECTSRPLLSIKKNRRP